MATDKKNRAQREDKESKGSVDNGNSSADASASLHARRAKLRGALGSKGSYSSDPFAAAPGSLPKADPYPTQSDPSTTVQSDPYAAQSDPYAAPSDPYAVQGNTYAAQGEPFAVQGDPYATQGDPYATQGDPFAAQPDPFGAEADPFVSPEYVEEQPSSYGLPETPANMYGVPVTLDEYISGETDMSTIPASEPEAVAEQAPELRRWRRSGSSTASASSPFEAAPTLPASSQTQLSAHSQVSDQTIELVNSIDQSLNVCATNLAALQNLAGEQTEVLKGLSQTLQNQTLLEIGLNLNSLTESLTAALEPMKAIGELVPALDSLVSTLEGKEQDQSSKMSPEQLVTNLSDQLSAGLIDPWTFKCASCEVSGNE